MKKEERNKKILEWIATTFSIGGAILNAFLIKEGFYLWVVANVIWLVFAWKSKHWGMALTYIVFLIICFVGIIYW
jgi:nicotinamide riboside transporter PnuC